MTEDEPYMDFSPPELLIYIFTFLTPKQLMKCRQVCSRWKRIVEDLTDNEGYWRSRCQKEFCDVYRTTYYKRVPDLDWFNIYKSLSLWSKLDQAIEIRDEFASASRHSQEIRDFKVMRYGLIGVQTRTSINYYDIVTLKQSTECSPIPGNYIRYSENDDTIVILGYNLKLYVLRKSLYSEDMESERTFTNVKSFLLVGDTLFYITLRDEVFICDLEEDILRSELLNQASSSIMNVGYKNGCLNLLTFRRDIYTIIGKELVHVKSLDSSTNLLHELKNYNFLENLDWRVYFQWMFVLKHTIPQAALRDIIIIKTYGDVVFVGSSWGVLRIYYAPYCNNEFDIFNSEPIKQYNFMERSDCPVLSTCPIIQIDIIEGEESHTVLVAMPKKIAVLSYRHRIVEETSVELVPDEEAQNVPTPNISE